MSTTVSHPPHRQIHVSRLRAVIRTRPDRHRQPVRPDGSRPTPVMGPANRAPGIPVMGAAQYSGDPVMGRSDAGPRVYVMGRTDDGVRHDVMGESDPRFLDMLFTGGATR
jgi:hypothetical protein